MKDYYKVLEVSKTATKEEIKKSYRRLALKYHPDRNQGNKLAENKFKEIVAAYEILSETTERNSYDYDYNKQETNSNSQQEQKRNESQSEPITATTFLNILIHLKKRVSSIEAKQINQQALYKSINDILTERNIDFLVAHDDIKTNQQIIETVCDCSKYLEYWYVEKLTPKLVKIAGTDNKTIQNIFSFNKHRKYWSYWDDYKIPIKIFGVIALIAIVSLTSKKSISTDTNRPKSGNLYINTPNSTPISSNNTVTPNSLSTIKFTTHISKDLLTAGEIFQVSFKLDCKGDNFKGPDFQDIDVLSGPNQSTNMSYVGGKLQQTVTYSYILTAKKEGNFSIGSAYADANGKAATSDPIKIKVSGGLKKAEDYSSWDKVKMNSGNSPECFNFTPKYDYSLDNKLQVSIGSNTDVVVKLINYISGKCIRYVYIRSGTTFNITNIPQGKYYTKIAYGKDWRQKIVNGQCVGKFIQNPLYKKGENILDFNKIYLGEVREGENNYKNYDIPSYSLSLDIISTNRTNELETNTISEDDFNE